LRKIILFIFIIISFSFSQNIINKKNFIKEYKKALENFKIQKYETAYNSLYTLFQQKSDNLNINFYLARSAFETKRYEESILAYERFLFIKPNNNRVKLEMARAYFMIASYKESKKILLEIKNNNKLPKVTSDIIDSYLLSINSKIKKNSINGILMIGALYDSNINNRSSHDTFNDIYFPAADTYIDVTNSTQDASNWYNQEIALVNHRYKISDNKVFKNDFLIFNRESFNSAHDDTKLTLVSYNPALSIKYNEKFAIDYSLYADYLSYGGKTKLKTFALFPKFQYLYNSKNKLSGYLKYQNKSDQQDKTQDKKFLEARLNLKKSFTKTIDFTTRVTITDEKAKDSTQTGIDYTKVKGYIALNYKYSPNILFTPALSYSISKYDDIDPNYLIKEKNKEVKAILTSTYIYSPQWIFQNNIDYTRQKSNIELNEYNKYTFAFNIIRTF